MDAWAQFKIRNLVLVKTTTLEAIELVWHMAHNCSLNCQNLFNDDHWFCLFCLIDNSLYNLWNGLLSLKADGTKLAHVLLKKRLAFVFILFRVFNLLNKPWELVIVNRLWFWLLSFLLLRFWALKIIVGINLLAEKSSFNSIEGTFEDL